MAEGEDSTPQPAADESAPAKKRSKLPLIASAVVLLAGGGAAAWYLGVLPFGGGKSRHAEATAAVEEGGHGKADFKVGQCVGSLFGRHQRARDVVLFARCEE